MNRRTKWAAVPLLVLAFVGAGVGGAYYANRPDPMTIAFSWPAELTVPDICANPPSKPFTPTTITIENVGKDIRMIAMPRNGYNIPEAPPKDDPSSVAWDRPPAGIPPGSAEGKSILSAHTWPNNAALGNQMLAKFDVGDMLRLSDGKQVLCYRVVDRTYTDKYTVPPGFYDRDGPHQIVFMVCSGTRLGPGNWSHRDTWYASPVSSSR